MQKNFPEAADFSEQKLTFGTFSAAATLILLPPLCFLTVPAIIFSKKSKTLYEEGNFNGALKLSKKSKRYTLSAWAIAAIVAVSLFALYFISRLSLI